MIALTTSSTFTEAGKRLGITRQGIGLRLGRLVKRGYVDVKVEGLITTYTFTDSGKDYFCKLSEMYPHHDMNLDYRKPIAVKKLGAERKADRDEIVSLRLGGRANHEISTEFGISVKHVGKILRESGIRAQKRFTKEEIQEAFSQGGTLTEIGQRLGVGRKAVARILDQEGIKKIKKRSSRAFTKQELEGAFSQGGTLTEMGQRIGVGKGVMAKLLDKEGIRPIRKLYSESFSREELEVVFNQGGTLAEMGQRIGISEGSMRALLDIKGIRKIKKRQVLAFTRQELEDTFSQGGSLEAMGQRIGVSRKVIARLLDEQGIRKIGESTQSVLAKRKMLKDNVAQMFIDRNKLREDIKAAIRRGNFEEGYELQSRLAFAEQDISAELGKIRRMGVKSELELSS
ncbi:MAG: hypothetical protein KGH67_01355 [Candidatus Micrarchaeota archaeon]|nr:hypothetical protein [Candidatus Micrarchaeota archaeon]MDE1859153.1 hypothetical protein [Candidatus Micrarchaeota archaeon]